MAVEKNKRALTIKANTLSKLQQQYTPVLRKLQEGSQNYNILKHLINRGTITAAEAVHDYDCYRLSGRIKDLRDMGVDIETEMIPTKTKTGSSHYAKYHLKGGNGRLR